MEAIDGAADPCAVDAAYLKTAERLLDMQRQHLAEVAFVRVTPKVAYWRTVLLPIERQARVIGATWLDCGFLQSLTDMLAIADPSCLLP